MQSRRQTRRSILGMGASAVTIALMVPLSACRGGIGSGGGTAAQVAPPAQLHKGATIRWAIDTDVSPTREALRQDQLKLFKAQFPDINVDFIRGATDADKVLALFAAGTPPDLFRQEPPGMVALVTRDQLTPLDPLLRRDKYDLSDFFPVAWDSWRWKGKYYGVPFLGIRFVYYNRALAKQVGVRPLPTTWRDSTWTWDSLLDTCHRVSLRQGADIVRWGVLPGSIRQDWQAWVWSNGGDLFTADGTKVLLGDPPAVEALQFLADLAYKEHVAPTLSELQAHGGMSGLFRSGNLLMYHFSFNNIARNRTDVGFDWSVTALPRGKAKQAAASGGGVAWFMAADTKVKDETWELMKVLASKDSVRLEAVRGEAPPSRRSVANEPAFINPPDPPGADMKVVVEALEVMRPNPLLLNGLQIDTILDEETKPLWGGTTTAREAMTKAVARITPLLNPAG